MKANLFFGSSAYAQIIDNIGSMDVLLNPGRGAWQSLRESAMENKEKAKILIRDADRMLEAASILENNQWSQT